MSILTYVAATIVISSLAPVALRWMPHVPDAVGRDLRLTGRPGGGRQHRHQQPLPAAGRSPTGRRDRQRRCHPALRLRLVRHPGHRVRRHHRQAGRGPTSFPRHHRPARRGRHGGRRGALLLAIPATRRAITLASRPDAVDDLAPTARVGASTDAGSRMGMGGRSAAQPRLRGSPLRSGLGVRRRPGSSRRSASCTSPPVPWGRRRRHRAESAPSRQLSPPG